MDVTKTATLRDHQFTGSPVYLNDLSKCVPSSALSHDPTPGRWRMMEYDAAGLSGVMLLAGPETAAPEITVPLGVAGLHAVSVGLFADQRIPISVLVRLTGDDTFSELRQKSLESEALLRSNTTDTHGSQLTGHNTQEIRELFWRTVDLTDKNLVMGQVQWRVAPGEGQGTRRAVNSRVAYVKLVPLSGAEAEALGTDMARTDTRRLFAHNDAHSPHFTRRPTTAEEMRREIEPYRDTDFSRMYWEAGTGDLLKYFSNIGKLGTYDTQGDFARQGDRLHGESWRVFRETGVDPFEAALGHARELGMEFHACYRVSGFNYPPPLDYNSQGPTFFKFHPELRSVDKNGRTTPRLSYAYPQVRGFVISLLREMARYDIDGVCLLYNRRPPVLDYEPPLVDGFIAEYGENPRQLSDEDPRWLSYRSRTLTQFHRDVRQAMDEVSVDRGLSKRLEVSAVTMRDEQENMLYAMDLKTWVDEDLVDTIIPYSSGPMLDSMSDSWSDSSTAKYFVDLTSGTSCTLALNIMPRHLSSDAYRSRIAALYAVGVENFFFWDSAGGNGRANFTSSYDALRRLGHKDEIDAWVSEGGPAHEPCGMELKKLGDWDYKYATPG